MPSVPSLVTAATFIVGSFAAVLPLNIGTLRQPAVNKPGTVSLKQVRNPSFVRHGPIALAKAYRKYGAPISDELRNAVINARIKMDIEKRATGSSQTTPEPSDVEFLTPVAIGTPPQTLNLDFDTGSSDLWVFSSGTPRSQVSGQAIYDAGKSNTSKEMEGYTWQISYGDGSSSSGNVYQDVVEIGGLTVQAQAVECATTVSDEFTSDGSSDGLLGLAFGSLNQVTPQPQKTFFDNAIGSLDSPVFTSDLRSGAPGFYNFGYVDHAAYSGNLTYTSVDNSRGFWGFTSSGYAVGQNDFQDTPMPGIADTGTTLLLLDDTVVKAYYDKIAGSRYDSEQSGYVFSCSLTPPDLTFGIADARITIPGKYINYSPIDSFGSSCFGGIQSDSGIGFSIWGDVALKAAFVVFDAGNNQLGWAPKAT